MTTNVVIIGFGVIFSVHNADFRLNGKSEKQQEYLVHILEEMAEGLDKLM